MIYEFIFKNCSAGLVSISAKQTTAMADINHQHLCITRYYDDWGRGNQSRDLFSSSLSASHKLNASLDR